MIEALNLKKSFPIERGLFRRKIGEIRAVDGINLRIEEGKTLGLVGESGCGKTTLGRLLLGLIEPDSGSIIKKGGIKSQVVFQDPFGSLNPRMKIKNIIIEGLLIEKSRENLHKAAIELLDAVGLPEESLHKYPHQFSGGERQRIGIARAIATKPKFIVCDEPVSSLDVSIRVQILKLLLDLQKQFGMSYLFIAHDLGVVQHVSDNVAVMYLGKIIESGPKDEVFKNTLHPYTKILLSSSPSPYLKNNKSKIAPKGDISSSLNPPAGCRFHPRCPYAFKPCITDEPLLKEIKSGHFCACYLSC